jgi:hypothetical protein
MGGIPKQLQKESFDFSSFCCSTSIGKCFATFSGEYKLRLDASLGVRLTAGDDGSISRAEGTVKVFPVLGGAGNGG